MQLIHLRLMVLFLLSLPTLTTSTLLSIAASLRTASDLSPFDLDPSIRTQLSEQTDTEFPDLTSSLVNLTRTEKTVLSLAPTSFFDMLQIQILHVADTT